jgi:signal transduction histidine kinase
VTGEPVPLSPEAGLTLYRAAQEALTNIRKHATAAAVDVCLAWSADQVALSVRDDGAGTGTSSAVARDTTDTTPGWGLAGMAERAGSIGAELQAGPTDRGFQVRMTLPLTPRVAEGTP